MKSGDGKQWSIRVVAVFAVGALAGGAAVSLWYMCDARYRVYACILAVKEGTQTRENSLIQAGLAKRNQSGNRTC